MTKRAKLTDSEQQVLLHQGTERPYSGRFHSHKAQGQYLCRQCGNPLYDASSKFDSGCGWPAFDEAYGDAVSTREDADGRRTEIICANCEGHLGHRFEGEGFTPTNMRDCVNSLSLAFEPKASEHTEETLIVGGGCFWCIEAIFQQIIGIKSVVSGYAGGQLDKPSYRQVCGGDTGHAEVVKLTFDPNVIDLQSVLELFFAAHDPTTLNRQGADVGPQYRSFIQCSESQYPIIDDYIQRFQRSGQIDGTIVTEVVVGERFFPAEQEHQDYYRQHQQQGYCQMVIDPKLGSIFQRFADRIKPNL